MKLIKPILPLLLCGFAAQLFAAEETGMRLAGRMLFPDPELAKPGACVLYREGGAGWILTEPVFWLRGTVVGSEIRNQRVERCPEVAGKSIEQYSRDEFVRLAKSQPCVSRDELAREESRGVIRLRVEAWETPYYRKLANAGRLYQGAYLDQHLEKGTVLEMDASLLGACK